MDCLYVAVIMNLRFVWMVGIESDTLHCCWRIPAEIIVLNFWVAGVRTGARVLEDHSHRADQAVHLTYSAAAARTGARVLEELPHRASPV